MLRRKLVAVLAVFAAVGLTLSACSQPPGEEGKDASQTEEDASAEDGSVDPDTGVADDDTSSDQDAAAPDTGMACQGCVDDKYKVEAKTCDSGNPPDRCSEKPEEYSMWGPGSVITSMELTSDEAKDCCFNIDGSPDGSNDNALAQLLGFIPDTDIDGEIKKSLAGGDFILLNEHDGLSDLSSGKDYNLNFYLGEFGDKDAQSYIEQKDPMCDIEKDPSKCDLKSASGKNFLINAESFDKGTHPQAQVSPAAIANSKDLNAGPGKVVINLTLPGIGNLGLVINGATIEAEVVKGESDVTSGGDGVVMKKGKLGGYVLMKDVIGLVNDLFENCDCLENPKMAITYPNTDPMDPDLKPNKCLDEDNEPKEGECEVACSMDVNNKASMCSGAGGLCEQAGTVCGFVGAFTNTADLDVDGDGQLDAVSIGALFEATGAKIQGIDRKSVV